MLESTQTLYFLVLAAFLVTLLMQGVRKNATLVLAYAVQSAALVGILVYLAIKSGDGVSAAFVLTAALTVIVKIVLTPRLLNRLIARHSLTNTSTTYLSLPLTLVAVIVLVAVANSRVFASLVSTETQAQGAFALAIATMMLSLLLLVNRKGVISQVIGILSLENAVVMCASFVGLEQSLGFEIGVSFDLVAWVTIASVFVSLVYKHFGTIDVSAVSRLTD